MKKTFIVAMVLLLTQYLGAQNKFSFTAKDSITGQPLQGVIAIVLNTNLGGVTNENGYSEIAGIPDSLQTIQISFLGYQKKILALHFPLTDAAISTIILAPDDISIDEVVVTSMRTNSRIEDLPQKVEVLGAEDLLEESTIKPGNISSILGDISVIHIQQTSATTGNVAVRMQGLDGKYTQILRDGIPAFDGFSGSFDVMSIPPLDLRQVEIIKGAASTLYGGGAIAGLINLISKLPTDSNEYTFTANYSSLREANVNGFFSGKIQRIGFTMFGGITHQMASDVNRDGFSDIARVVSYTAHPRLFFDLAPNVKMNIGYSGTFETREGGDMHVLKFKVDSAHQYFEENKIQRHTADLRLFLNFKRGHTLEVKGATNIFDRLVNQSGLQFHGQQLTVYAESSYQWQTAKNSFVTGVNVLNDGFRKLASDSLLFGNFNYQTIGLFAQDNWQINKRLSIEAGMRVDYHTRYRFFFLPRLSLLVKPIKTVTVRISSGTGYKAPGLFAAKDFSGRYNQLQAVDNGVKAEYSIGANTDINYHTVVFNELSLELNQAFYYTHIRRPLYLIQNASNYSWANSAYNINSWGSDTYIRLAYKALEVYLGYNHTTSRQKNVSTNIPVLFAPQDKLSNTIVYEIENKWRFGIEGSLIANQFIRENIKARNYYLLAAMVERKIGKHWSVILNGENLLNVKQSTYQSLYTGSRLTPVFNQLYAPIDGWVVNLCIQLRL